ncbi:divalent-cation tolerance protein CutA [Microbispora hainanensis]|uniref:divalent-cation tolerance protein CutA n=1 Tax=Microbispora hainanensis TaxID=568844 RepID=UPI0033F3EA4F
MDEVCEVIITAPDPEWLVEFTRSLVTDRLCAAGHNFAPIRSIYRWQGEIYDRTEGRVALHTRRDLVPQIIERTNQEHPYEVPCVVTLPITSGDQEYLNWILTETAEPT